MAFGVLDPENIWHQWLVLHLPTSPVYCSHFAFGNPKSHFSTVLFSLRYTTHQVEQFIPKMFFFSSSGFPEWRAYIVRTFNLPLSKTMFSINTLSLCLSTFTTLSTRFSATNIPTPADYPYLPSRTAYTSCLELQRTCSHCLSISFLEYIPHPRLCPPTPPPVHPSLPIPGTDPKSSAFPQFLSPQVILDTTLCLSTGLCCVLAWFPHLLSLWACGGAHGVIPNNRTFCQPCSGFYGAREDKSGIVMSRRYDQSM